MLYNVVMFNTPDDISGFVEFKNVADTDANNIVRFAMEYGKAINVTPVEVPVCEDGSCDF